MGLLNTVPKITKTEEEKRPDITNPKNKRTPKSSNKNLSLFTKLSSINPLQPCFLRFARFQYQKEILKIEKEFIKSSSRASKYSSSLSPQEKRTLASVRGNSIPIATLDELLDENSVLVSSSFLPSLCVGVSSIVDQEILHDSVGGSVMINKQNQDIVGILDDDEDPLVTVMRVEKAPDVTYASIGGLSAQIQELKESVELPLSSPELYDQIGITPPKGVIFYGPPGTGKTLLAKAVAAETSATFLHMVGSELVQKYSGEGPKLVRKLFRAAAEHSPSIVFIDEIDSIGMKRRTKGSSDGGEREIQRTLLELLNQLDGFDNRKDVKVILATNRIEALDSALIRPGRIDRKIKFPKPDEETRRAIFKIHTGKMRLEKDVNLEEFVKSKNDFSGAEIKAICTEAGLLALRERRMEVMQNDFRKAVDTAVFRKVASVPTYLYV